MRSRSSHQPSPPIPFFRIFIRSILQTIMIGLCFYTFQVFVQPQIDQNTKEKDKLTIAKDETVKPIDQTSMAESSNPQSNSKDLLIESQCSLDFEQIANRYFDGSYLCSTNQYAINDTCSPPSSNNAKQYKTLLLNPKQSNNLDDTKGLCFATKIKQDFPTNYLKADLALEHIEIIQSIIDLNDANKESDKTKICQQYSFKPDACKIIIDTFKEKFNQSQENASQDLKQFLLEKIANYCTCNH